MRGQASSAPLTLITPLLRCSDRIFNAVALTSSTWHAAAFGVELHISSGLEEMNLAVRIMRPPALGGPQCKGSNPVLLESDQVTWDWTKAQPAAVQTQQGFVGEDSRVCLSSVLAPELR